MPFELSIPRPRTTLAQLREAVISEDAPSDASIQLIIALSDSDVNIREFSAYLGVMDRTYGRLCDKPLASYSQTRYVQLAVSFRQGSLEIVISELLRHVDYVTAIVVLRFFLKYLPKGVKDFAAAYRDYEEGRLVRERRRQLREEIKHDHELATLNDNRKNQILGLLDKLYWHERRQLAAAQRFAVRYVQRIILKVIRKDDSKD